MVLDAVIAALVGALFYGLAAALQHHEAARLPASTATGPRLLLHLARRPLWLAGIACTVLGAALHLFALSEAPVTLIQPLGVTAVVFAVPLAAALGHHRMRLGELAAALAVLAGLAVVLGTLPVGHGSARGVDLDSLAGLLIATGAAVALPAVALKTPLSRVAGPRTRSLLLGLSAGVAFGATSGSARLLFQVVNSAHGVTVAPALLAGAAIAVLAPLGFLLIQNAYRAGGFAIALATVTVIDPAYAALCGVLMLHEPVATSPAREVLIGCGAALATLGIAALARSPAHRAGDLPGAEPDTTPRPDRRFRITVHAHTHDLDPAAGTAADELDQHPVRLLIGTDTYHPDVNGAAYFTYRLATGLARRGHDVHVVCPSADGAACVRLEDGVWVHRLRSVGTLVHPTFRASLPPATSRAATSLLRDLRPDVVHVQGHFPIGRAVLRAAHRQSVPVVATNHFMPENLLPYGHVPNAARRAACALAWRDFTRVFNHADVITTPTPIAADLIRGRGLSPRIEAISCGIDLDRFRADAPSAPSRPASVRDLPDRPTLLFVGRLDDEKHVHELIGALPLVRRTHDAQVALAGTGTQQQHLAGLADRLGVSDHVHFLGFVPDSELPEVYRASDVFVMPGVAELQSLVTLEAMASGMPVIAADAMALPHLVHPGVNGYLYPSGDIPELAAHVEALLASPAERNRMGKASRQMVSRHDVTATLARFECLYAEVTGSPVSTGAAASAGNRLRTAQ